MVKPTVSVSVFTVELYFMSLVSAYLPLTDKEDPSIRAFIPEPFRQSCRRYAQQREKTWYDDLSTIKQKGKPEKREPPRVFK